MSDGKYFNRWSSRADIISHIGTGDRAEWLKRNPEFPTEDEILWAWYGGGAYDGTAESNGRSAT